MINNFNQLNKQMVILIEDIIAERERQGITQQRLAQIADIKQSAISRMESLKAMPQLDTLFKIIHSLNLRISLEQINNIKENNMKIQKADLNLIDVEVTFCNLEIIESSDENVYFTAEEPDEFFVQQDDNAIILKQKKRNLVKKLFDWTPIKAQLKIPHAHKGGLKVKNKDGKVKATRLDLDSLIIETNNGRLEAEDICADIFNAQSDNGAILFNNINAANFEAESDNGKIQAQNINCDKIDFKSDNGRVIVRSVNTDSINIESDNGKIVLDGLKANHIKLLNKNGRTIAAIEENQELYAMEISLKNGTLELGGQKYHGSYIYKDKDKPKTLIINSKNGGVKIAFADTKDKLSDEIENELNDDND